LGVALLALFLAIGGTGYAALQISGAQIKDATVTGADVRNGSLGRADLAPGLRGIGLPKRAVMWIDHFSFLPGDPSVTTSHNAVSSGVGGGLTGLVIASSTTGENATGGNKVVHRALEVPPGSTIKRVRVCYELSNARSFISQIRLAQVQPVPSSAVVKLDDATDLTSPGPVCVTSAAANVVASAGPVLISLRVNFGDTSDKIALRGVGVQLAS
jgi:hypothetical protein